MIEPCAGRVSKRLKSIFEDIFKKLCSHRCPMITSWQHYGQTCSEFMLPLSQHCSESPAALNFPLTQLLGSERNCLNSALSTHNRRPVSQNSISEGMHSLKSSADPSPPALPAPPPMQGCLEEAPAPHLGRGAELSPPWSQWGNTYFLIGISAPSLVHVITMLALISHQNPISLHQTG